MGISTERFGPALFAAILPATGASGGSSVAQKLRPAVEQATGWHVHCAVAAFPRHAASAGELIEEAEAALGLARAGGESLHVAGVCRCYLRGGQCIRLLLL